MLFKKNPKTETNYDSVLDPQNFILKLNFWDSSAEEKIYKFLKLYIHESYTILPHVAFKDIFSFKNEISDEYIASNLLHITENFHFDFVIFDKYFLPVLFIEANGRTHTKESKKKIDMFKRQLISANSYSGLQLLEIDLYDSMTDEELKELVRKSLYGNITSRNKYPTYCSKCHLPMILRDGTNGLFYTCSHCKSDYNPEKQKTVTASIIPHLLRGMS